MRASHHSGPCSRRHRRSSGATPVFRLPRSSRRAHSCSYSCWRQWISPVSDPILVFFLFTLCARFLSRRDSPRSALEFAWNRSPRLCQRRSLSLISPSRYLGRHSHLTAASATLTTALPWNLSSLHSPTLLVPCHRKCKVILAHPSRFSTAVRRTPSHQFNRQ